ncbi:MAG: NAD(P)/FAD-dependent oxidoreductase [Pseudomonadales bacterium]|nr:NAD(P)/FAD-dependent oxidoreductase [Pseudomonadales bacterium]
MTDPKQDAAATADNTIQQYDAIVIGAGMAGMYQIYKFQEAGLSVRAFETGSGVGGTWYWNRYPGCKFDSESYSYGYSFSEELLQEWNWKEHFSRQPDTERYLNLVADKFDIRKNIEFNSRIKSAKFDESQNRWLIETDAGIKASAKYLVTGVGPLSAHTMPNYKGMDNFKGGSWHTARWPKEKVDFTGKRVAVIGTGATGVQVIQEMVNMAEHLTVYQRNPNWCAPLNNGLITDQEQTDIKASYPEIFDKCKQTHGGFIHSPDMRSVFDVTPEERDALYEKLYAEKGFGIWVGSFYDTQMTEEANQSRTDFIANKIRGRINDPALAEKLIPKDHGFGTKRVPLETNYYEAYNQDNVDLVDLRETPIEEVTAKGIKTKAGELEFDYIIYATGFDPVTGALNRIDITGRNDLKLKDKWSDGPLTYLGLQSVGFPNFFTLVGPHNAATLCNIPRCIEQNVEWVTDLVGHMEKNDLKVVEPKPESEKSWTEEVLAAGEVSPFMKVNSWLSGINSNVPGKQERSFQVYAGGAPKYREYCDTESGKNYDGFSIS